ncbi:hypothetical protein QUF64_00725 [Anaerolineales bacterium HSG6]|nr:hypothetical protein [Anaerolineales bacterium HSG6]MDM8532292.1 hypothetical protein [Anaerolineales bacterium HSG25]
MLMGLVSLYTVTFNRQALIEGSPKASLAMTASIAVVMGSIITVVGLFTLSRGFGF